MPSSDASSSTGGTAPSSESTREASMDDEIVREISLEEFNPYGTLALNGLYFVLLLVLYALLYFVEFAGRSPSIIE
jgi:hypothetical protein